MPSLLATAMPFCLPKKAPTQKRFAHSITSVQLILKYGLKAMGKGLHCDDRLELLRMKPLRSLPEGRRRGMISIRWHYATNQGLQTLALCIILVLLAATTPDLGALRLQVQQRGDRRVPYHAPKKEIQGPKHNLGQLRRNKNSWIFKSILNANKKSYSPQHPLHHCLQHTPNGGRLAMVGWVLSHH